MSAMAMWGLAVSGTFVYTVTISTIARLLIMMTSCAALPVLRLREKQPAPFVAPAGWLVSAVGLFLCVWLLSSSPLRHARDVAIAAAIGLIVALSYRAIECQRRAGAPIPSPGGRGPG